MEALTSLIGLGGQLGYQQGQWEGEGLPEPRGQGQAGGGFKQSRECPAGVGPQRRGSLQSSCRYKERTVTAGDITVFH